MELVAYSDGGAERCSTSAAIRRSKRAPGDAAIEWGRATRYYLALMKPGSTSVRPIAGMATCALALLTPTTAKANVFLSLGPELAFFDQSAFLGPAAEAGVRVRTNHLGVSASLTGRAIRWIASQKTYIDSAGAWFEYGGELGAGTRVSLDFYPSADENLLLGVLLDGGYSHFDIVCWGDFCWLVDPGPASTGAWSVGAGVRAEIPFTKSLSIYVKGGGSLYAFPDSASALGPSPLFAGSASAGLVLNLWHTLRRSRRQARWPADLRHGIPQS